MAKAIRYFHKGTTMFDGSNIANGYHLFQYIAGSTTKANTYTDAAKGTPNANPMTLNSSGRLDQDVYIDQSMKFVLTTAVAGDPPTSSVWTIDNALSLEQLWTTVSKTSNYASVEADRDKLIRADATSGTLTVTLIAAATAGDGFMLAVKKIDSSGNAVIIDANASETIDGALTLSLSNQNEVAMLISNGTSWNIVNSAAAQSTTIAADNATNTAVTNVLTVQHTTSGTPTAGIGTGILFNSESADESPSNFGVLAFVSDDVTAGSEDTYLLVQNRVAGAALGNAYKFKRTGVGNILFTTAATAERTVTLADADLAFTYSGGKATFAGTLTGNRTYTLPDNDFTFVQPATQAEMETGTSTTTAVSPGRTQYHAGVCKMWATISVSGGTPSLDGNYNVTSITDTSPGNITVTIATDFSSAVYCAIAQAVTAAGVAHMASVKTGQAAGSLVVRTALSSTGADTDNINLVVAAFGDQA